jgi:SAM-dependent methyltransferase
MTKDNATQIEFWNGETGRNWVTHDALMEAMLQPLGESVMDALAPKPGEHVLDIGCGCGHTSLSLADRVGAEGAVTGIDISAPMLAVASHLATERSSIQFVEADAQTHAFGPERYDLVFSRFGVMFFEDPIAAFTNIRSAMRASARLAFCCWQPRAVNPFMTVPAMAALELLPAPAEVPPRSPGPFAFEDPDYINEILSSSGFSDVAIESISHPLLFGPGLSVKEIVERLVTIGPIAQMVREAPDKLQQPVREKVIAAVSPFYDPVTGLTLDGEFWQVTAAHLETRRTGNT